MNRQLSAQLIRIDFSSDHRGINDLYRGNGYKAQASRSLPLFLRNRCNALQLWHKPPTELQRRVSKPCGGTGTEQQAVYDAEYAPSPRQQGAHRLARVPTRRAHLPEVGQIEHLDQMSTVRFATVGMSLNSNWNLRMCLRSTSETRSVLACLIGRDVPVPADRHALGLAVRSGLHRIDLVPRGVRGCRSPGRSESQNTASLPLTARRSTIRLVRVSLLAVGHVLVLDRRSSTQADRGQAWSGCVPDR